MLKEKRNLKNAIPKLTSWVIREKKLDNIIDVNSEWTINEKLGGQDDYYVFSNDGLTEVQFKAMSMGDLLADYIVVIFHRNNIWESWEVKQPNGFSSRQALGSIQICINLKNNEIIYADKYKSLINTCEILSKLDLSTFQHSLGITDIDTMTLADGLRIKLKNHANTLCKECGAGVNNDTETIKVLDTIIGLIDLNDFMLFDYIVEFLVENNWLSETFNDDEYAHNMIHEYNLLDE